MQEDTSHYEGALQEEIRDQNKAIIEGLAGFSGVPAKVDKIAEAIEEIKIDIKAIKSVVKNHEGRVTTLEAA